MITVQGAAFYENFATRPDGSPIFTGKYDELHFDEYPVTTDIDTFAVDLHAVGDFDGFYFIRVWQGEEMLHETALTHLHGRDGGKGGDIGMFGSIQGVTFPRPGVYRFDVIFDNSVLHSVLLNLIETKKKKRRPR